MQRVRPQPARSAARRARRARARRWASIPASAPASRSPWWTRPARSSRPRRSIRTSRSDMGESAADPGPPAASQHKVELIAIGNGTAIARDRQARRRAGRRAARAEADQGRCQRGGRLGLFGLSAYASAELPDLDVSLRGAVSIARRLQDPLAELVKIDPKSIGVGQYQHDVDQIQARRARSTRWWRTA